jgi:hypothetical protein
MKPGGESRSVAQIRCALGRMLGIAPAASMSRECTYRMRDASVSLDRVVTATGHDRAGELPNVFASRTLLKRGSDA